MPPMGRARQAQVHWGGAERQERVGCVILLQPQAREGAAFVLLSPVTLSQAWAACFVAAWILQKGPGVGEGTLVPLRLKSLQAAHAPTGLDGGMRQTKGSGGQRRSALEGVGGGGPSDQGVFVGGTSPQPCILRSGLCEAFWCWIQITCGK